MEGAVALREQRVIGERRRSREHVGPHPGDYGVAPAADGLQGGELGPEILEARRERHVAGQFVVVLEKVGEAAPAAHVAVKEAAALARGLGYDRRADDVGIRRELLPEKRRVDVSVGIIVPALALRARVRGLEERVDVRAAALLVEGHDECL